jgi:hypothetical protein
VNEKITDPTPIPYLLALVAALALIALIWTFAVCNRQDGQSDTDLKRFSDSLRVAEEGQAARDREARELAFAAAFDEIFARDVWPLLRETGAFTQWAIGPERRSLTVTITNDWYDLPYPTKKDLAGTIYLLLWNARVKAGADPKSSCSVYIEDRWGETVAECRDPQNVKIKR